MSCTTHVRRQCLRCLAALSILLLVAGVFTACSKEPTPTIMLPTRTPKPTFSPTSVPTPTIVPSRTATLVSTSTHTPLPPTATPTVLPTDTPTLKPSRNPLANPLTGLGVDDAARLQRRPILVRYGNDEGGRPLAGLSQAEVVYEDLMEGNWITRLTAVFLAQDPEAIGPIRSARPVNLELVPQYDGVFVFSGASIGVTELLSKANFPQIHEGTPGNGFYRSAKKKVPYNLYGSIIATRKYMADKGLEKPVALKGFVFSEEGAEPPKGQPALKMHIPYPATSTVDYTYDRNMGLYMRFVQGEPYVDELTNKQIGVANVIVQYVEHQNTNIVEDSLGSTSLNLVTTGEGRVQILRDGVVLEGLWRRAQLTDFPVYLDAQGKPIPLKPGTSWVQFVPPSYKLDIIG